MPWPTRESLTTEDMTLTDDSTNQSTNKPQEEQSKSMLRIIAGQFAEHRMAMTGLILLAVLVLIAAGAPFISSLFDIDPEAQSVFNRYAPPMSKIELSRSQQDQILEAFATEIPGRTEALVEQLKTKGFIQDTGSPPVDAFLDFVDMRDDGLVARLEELNSAESASLVRTMKGFHRFHILGTDELGRDVLARLIYGARVSIGVGVLVALAGAIIGILIGSIAGYYGGWIDGVLMRITDSLLALPILPLMIVFAAVDLNKLPFLGSFISGGNESIMKLVVILVLFSWMEAARLIRGNILSVREREFVLAAVTLGAKSRTIIQSHIVPNVIAPLLVAVTLRVGSSILFEAALSFLGLGIQPPTPSWGNMLFNAQEIIHEAPQLAVMPGLLIFITVICFNFVGDGLQDAIDPKSIRR